MAEATARPTIAIDLIEQVEHGQCIVFAGPGISMAPRGRLGPPGPALLAIELAERLGGQLDDYSFPWVAQYYAYRRGIESLRTYVAKRLNDINYRPTQAHYLLTRIPFEFIVYTAQDHLLQDSFRTRRIQITYGLHDLAAAFLSERNLIQLYGTAEQHRTLRLTEDEHRELLDREITNFLRLEANRRSPLFLGYTLKDSAFREFYYYLRVRRSVQDTHESERLKPRAYLVCADATVDDVNYWQGRNATVVRMEAAAFLQELVAELSHRGKLEVDSSDGTYEEPLPMNPEEKSRREDIIRKFGERISPNTPVESGSQLSPLAGAWNLFRQAIAEQEVAKGRIDGTRDEPTGKTLDDITVQMNIQQGNAEWVAGNLREARTLFERAIEQAPGIVEAHLSLYFLLVETGEYQDASKVYRSMLDGNPERAFLPDRYRIQEILGQTEVGISYLVHDSERVRPVTITVLRQALAHQTETLDKFISEVSEMESERISGFFGDGSHHIHRYLITEYVEGSTLRERLGRDKQVPLIEALEFAAQIAEGLEDGHRQGVPHLNLDPVNVVLTADRVKLTNYGFSRLLPEDEGHASKYSDLGTDYEAPEQLVGERGDERSDVYALGTILYEMLVGRPPGLGAYQPVSEVHAEAGEAIELLINHSRSLYPADRFQSIEEMGKEIKRISLSTKKGWPGQYVRLALSRLSDLYAGLFSPIGRIAGLTFVAIYLLIEVGNWESLVRLRGLLRLIWLFLVNCLACGAMAYYMVRETARRRGLGSLISSGRGIGVSLGLLLSIFIFRSTIWGQSGLELMCPNGMMEYHFISLSWSVVTTFLAVLMMTVGGRVLDKLKSRYILGFYSSYLVLAIFFAFLAVAGPEGIIGSPPAPCVWN